MRVHNLFNPSGIIVWVSLSLSIIIESPHYEVKQYAVEKSPIDRSCSLLYIRTIPRLSLLNGWDDTHVQTQISHDEGKNGRREHLLVYGYTDEAIKSELSRHCSFFSNLQPQPEGGSDFFVQGDAVNGYDARTAIPPPPIFPDPPSPIEITPLHNPGPTNNRVNLVFFGDGYTKHEKEKFLRDAKRLSDDLITNQTFVSVKPLINIWAAFTPSNESGIGRGGKPKDTVYGLYRDGTELRGVYAKNEMLAHAACGSLQAQCSFPILLGNDPLYGGIGGLVTITTSSVENGALVLRHELGHSIILVGEEYDGGYTYSGVNADNKLINGTKWAHWLTEPTLANDKSNKSIRAERSVMPLQVYAWTLLNTSSPYTSSFISSGTFSRYLVRFSLSGIPSASHLRVSLDGEDLGWEPKKGIGMDRWHYDIPRDMALAGGEHELVFELKEGAEEGSAQLCSFEILEYGNESEFNTTSNHIAAYPTYSNLNTTTYRPTNEDCLMRLVTAPNFCSPCLEGLWLSLLSRIRIFDSLTSPLHPPDEHSDKRHVLLTIGFLPLGQFANSSELERPDKEYFTIRWSKLETGEEYPEFDDKNYLPINAGDERKFFKLETVFHTEEVRKQNWTQIWYIAQLSPIAQLGVGEEGTVLISEQPHSDYLT